jgi:hypothetical protein
MEAPEAVKQVARSVRQRRAWLTLLLVMQLWLYANGRALLGREFPLEVVQFYLFFMLAPLVVDRELLESLLKGTPGEYVLKFSMGFLVGLASYLAVFSTLFKAPAAPIAFSAVYPLMAVQMFFVAPAEELFFRGFMPRLYDPDNTAMSARAKMYGGISGSAALWAASFTVVDVATSATFSAFHYGAYGPNAWSAFLIAFIMSVVWLHFSRREVEYPWHKRGDTRPMGIAFTIGWHFAFNMCAFGIFTGGVVFGN